MKRAGDIIAKLHRWAKKRRNDRGSAIIIVIIAMAMIGILATTLLWMAYMNYMIKVSDIRNKNSFYTAEEVVEQIMSGLRQESAEAVGVAYREVLSNWDNLKSEAERNNLFMMTYMDTLIDYYKDTTRSPATDFYDRKILKSYVDDAIFQSGTPNKGVDETAWEWGGASGDPKGDAIMELANNNSIILKNIYVSCTDDEGRVSIVKTDICLDVPKLVFENPGSIDALYQYILIGNKGIDVKVPGAIKTEGSIYAGTDENGVGGLQVGEDTAAATNLTMENALRVISKGDIKVDPASRLLVRDVLGQDNRVYARNITLDSATASLDSKVYVANDLTLDGVGSRVSLTKEYYGYGDSTDNGLPNADGTMGEDGDPAASSAIIINGRDSTVDMSSVTRLLIAGRSYIGPRTGNAAGEEAKYTNTSDPSTTRMPVMMGESIAVKGGQVAYLVPAECIGTLEGETAIGQNPVNGEKENDIIEFKKEYGDDFKEVDFDKEIYRLNGKTLRDMGVGSSIPDKTDADDMKYIRKVYLPYNNGTLTYYYLVLDEESAEKYFVQYYDFNANREEIDTYFKRYLSGGFLLGDFDDPMTEYTILGNSLVSSALTDSGVTLLTSVDQTTLDPTPPPAEGEEAPPPADPDDYTETGVNAEEVTNDRKDDETEGSVTDLTQKIKKNYKSLTYNLMDEASFPPFADPDNDDYDKGKAAEYVFKSIIKCKEAGGSADNVEDYLAGLGKNQVIYTTSSGLKACLAKNDVSLTGISGPNDAFKYRLIVCLGNVTVDHDFTGLIIAKGKITVTGGNSIKLGGTELADVLQANSQYWAADGSGDNTKPIDLFRNAGGTLLNGAQTPNVDSAGNLALDYSELVRYMNWIKK